MQQQNSEFESYLNVRIPAELAEAIRRAAIREERSVSSFVRKYLRLVVDHDVRRDDGVMIEQQRHEVAVS